MKHNRPLHSYFRDEPHYVWRLRAMTVKVGGLAWQVAWWLGATRVSSMGGRV